MTDMLMPRLTDPDVLRERLARAGIHPRRESGQNFLVSPEVIEATLLALSPWLPTAGRITELGAGLGTLTQALIGCGAQVRAIEREVALANLISTHVPAAARSRLTVVADDLRTNDWTWDGAYLLAGSIPYNLSGLILRRLTQLTPAPEAAVFLVQREVAERVVAKPPNMSLVGLAVQLWGEATNVLEVPPACFWPEPQVRSALILIVPHTAGVEPREERERVMACARVFFQAKRKQMGSVARRAFGLSESEVKLRFSEAGVGMQQRPQEIDVKKWRKLADALGSPADKGVL